MTTTESVVLVDRLDNQLGTADKMAAHTDGLLHRAFSVFVIRRHDDAPQLLLQRRAAAKYHFGSLWTNACCGHPRDGEAVVAAGVRRLEEEMGLRCDLESVGNFIYEARSPNGLLEHEYDHVLFGAADGAPIPNTAEVEDHRWLTIVELDAELQLTPSAFTPWLAPALDFVRDRV